VNSPGARTSDMSPTVTGISSGDAFRRSTATIGSDSSMPWTSTPRSRSGTATRPVPIASSSAGPSPASSARKSTVGPRTSGENIRSRGSS